MHKFITLLASIITILQFFLQHEFGVFPPKTKTFVLSFGIETRAAFFLLIQLLIFYLAVTIAKGIFKRTDEEIWLFFVMGLNAILIGYASTMNFRIFWERFNPWIPVINPEGGIGHGIYLAATILVTLFITGFVAEEEL